MSLTLGAERDVGFVDLRAAEQHLSTGIDSSSAMLRCARQKIADATLLYQNLSSDLSIDNSSKDLILSSFVLSYLDDLQIFALECARIVRPGGCLLISDMHPATAAKRDWKRSFHIDGVKIEIPATVTKFCRKSSQSSVTKGLMFKL